MRRTGVVFGGLAGLLLMLASPARGQVVWDGPMMLSPGSAAGWGLHLVEAHRSDGVGGIFTWRSNAAPVGMGFRVGVVDGEFEDAALLAGLDVAGAVYDYENDDYGLDVMWIAGAGMAVDDAVVLSFPFGMAVGWSFEEEGFALRPFVAPRLVLDARLGDLPPAAPARDEFDLGFAAEVGVDLAFDPRFGVRAAGSFGDREALSIGVTFPGWIR